MKGILLSLAAVATSLSAFAVSVDGIEYTLDNSALTATTTAELTGNGYQGDIVIPDEITAAGRTYKVVGIGQSTFEGNIITSVKIGNNVTSIGKWAFYGCGHLTKVEFGTGIGNYAEIPANAFQQSKAITSVTCNATVPAYLYSAGFASEVYTNATLFVPENAIDAYKDMMAGYGWYNFKKIQGFKPAGAKVDVVNINGLVYNLNHDDLTASVAAAYTANGYDISGYSGNVVIPSEVEANDATYTVTSLYPECFYQTSPITIKFPETLKTVGWESFYHISSLLSLDFPDSVEEIEAGCFNTLSNLTEITLGSGMKTIAGKSTYTGYCFQDLAKCTTLTCKATTPPTIQSLTFQPAFKSKATLKVPYGTVEAYKAAPYWDGFAAYEELPNPTVGVSGIEAADEAPARYLNLQGVEVVPADGQLVIEVRGGKTTKKIFRN